MLTPLSYSDLVRNIVMVKRVDVGWNKEQLDLKKSVCFASHEWMRHRDVNWTEDGAVSSSGSFKTTSADIVFLKAGHVIFLRL